MRRLNIDKREIQQRKSEHTWEIKWCYDDQSLSTPSGGKETVIEVLGSIAGSKRVWCEQNYVKAAAQEFQQHSSNLH
jgi:hypothetical protein